MPACPGCKLLTSVNLWALCLMYFCGSYGWYFNITYLPQLSGGAVHGDANDGWVGRSYKGGPLWLGAVGCLVGGC